MKLWFGCICVTTVLLIAIIVISILIATIEKYTTLRNVGKFPLNLVNTRKMNTESKSGSAKYKGHRYNVHHERRNPHQRYND
jgi:hypothetical protein